jgi:hypothetical protein
MAAQPGIIESEIILKQGDTFYKSFTATDASGSPVTGLASSFKSQVLDKENGTVYGTLTITESGTSPGTYIMQSGSTNGVQDTQTWKTGNAIFDIQYTASGKVFSTYTIKFKIVGDGTR